jgi:hypothetical protein
VSKKTLQIILAILSLIPIFTGGLDLILGARSLNVVGSSISLEAVNDIVLDSQIRFLASIWLGFGIILVWTIPSIDRQTILFRLLMGGVFLGGIGRLASAVLVGVPPIQFIAVIILELIIIPILVLWQSSISSDNNAIDRMILIK